MTVYLDASAILRIVFRERGPRCPSWPPRTAFSSHIVIVEAHRALEREHLAGRLSSADWVRKRREVDNLLRTVEIVPLDGEVVALGRLPFGVSVRALDALHIASALAVQHRLGAALEFWTHDATQARAAEARALVVRGLSG